MDKCYLLVQTGVLLYIFSSMLWIMSVTSATSTPFDSKESVLLRIFFCSGVKRFVRVILLAEVLKHHFHANVLILISTCNSTCSSRRKRWLIRVVYLNERSNTKIVVNMYLLSFSLYKFVSSLFRWLWVSLVIKSRLALWVYISCYFVGGS